MTKPKLADISPRTRLEIFAAVFILFNLAFLLFSFYHKFVLGEIWPIADPLYDPVFRFLDFYEINMAIYGLNPYLAQLTNYPPLAILLALPFALIPDYSKYDSFGAVLGNDDPAIKMSLLVFVIIFYVCVLGTVLLGIAIKRRKKDHHDYFMGLLLFALLAVSLPVVFAIDRGNYLLFTVIFLVMWAVLEEERPDSFWGAVFLGLAAATKVYPVYMLIIYVIGRRFKKLAVTIVTGLVTTILPMFLFNGTLYENCRAFYHGVLGFGDGGTYVLNHNIGLTALVGYLYRMNGLLPENGVTKIVWFVSGVVLTLAAGFLLFFEKTNWKKVLIVTGLMIFLTPNSGLYNSCYLIAPIVIMVLGDGEFKKADIPYLVITALLMVPFAYTNLPDTDCSKFYNDLNEGVLIHGLLYLALALYYICTGAPNVIKTICAGKAASKTGKPA